MAVIATASAAVNTPAPAPNSQLIPVRPHAENGPGQDAGVYLPPIAGPQSEIMGTVVADQGSGPTEFYVAEVLPNGDKRYMQGHTDSRGRFHFKLSARTALAGLLLFKHFDAHGQPDTGAACQIAPGDVHLPDTETVINPPPSGPAILETNTAFERGGMGQGLIQLHTRGVDPLRSAVLVDGSDRNVDTLAASDKSLVGRLHDDIPLGRHRIGAKSGNRRTNDQEADVVAERFDQLAAMRSGDVRPVRLHIDGLNRDAGIVIFDVSGSAQIADGSKTKSVPVVNGVATCDIRATNPGQLLIKTVLHVALPLVALLPQLLDHDDHGGNATPIPSEEPSPFPTRPITIGNPTPTPVPTPTPTPTPQPVTPPDCTVKMTHGWFEPTQGVWQDDPDFSDHFGKEITLELCCGVKEKLAAHAELPMVVGRDTLIFGVNRFGPKGIPTPDERQPDANNKAHNVDKDYIEMGGETDCTTPVKVKMAFTLIQNGKEKAIYESGVLGTVDLDPPKGKPHTFVIRLQAPKGIPPESAPPGDRFQFVAGQYVLRASLERDDGKPAQLSTTVLGQAVKTVAPKTHFVVVRLTTASKRPTFDAGISKTLQQDAQKYGDRVRDLMSDYFPLAPKALPVVAEPPKYVKIDSWYAYEPHRWRDFNQDLVDQLGTSALLEDAGRVVAIFAPGDMQKIWDDKNAAGADPDAEIKLTAGGKTIKLNHKVTYVSGTVSALDAIHELAHSIPPGWSSAEMERDCTKPGDYHNKNMPVANGVRLYVLGSPTFRGAEERVIQDGNYPIMGNPVANEIDKVWIAQCTYWNLINHLQKPPDPPVVLLRGRLLRENGFVKGRFAPAYALMGEVDLRPAARSPYAIVVLGERRAPLTRYAFEPDLWRHDKSSFMFRIRRDSRIRTIELVHDGQVLDTLRLSDVPPTLTVARPSVNDRQARLTWSGRSQNGRPLLYTVLKSVHDGGDYITESFEQTPSRLTLQLDPASRFHKIKVIATDGSTSTERVVELRTP